MKKLITFLIIAFAFNCSVVLAQTKPAIKSTAKPAAKAPAKAKMSKADSLMCDKEWHVTSVEEWAIVTKPPAEINKNDMLKLSLDGTYSLIMFSKPYSGTWSKPGQSITLKGVEGFFKVLVQEPGKLKLDHFSTEDGHSIFEYEAK